MFSPNICLISLLLLFTSFWYKHSNVPFSIFFQLCVYVAHWLLFILLDTQDYVAVVCFAVEVSFWKMYGRLSFYFNFGALAEIRPATIVLYNSNWCNFPGILFHDLIWEQDACCLWTSKLAFSCGPKNNKKEFTQRKQ